MSKLDNFTETTPVTPNYINDTADTDEIVIGGTCTHIFELPFIYTEMVKKAKVVYRQGLKTVLTVDIKDSMVHIHKSNSIIYVYLPKIYTELFDATLLDTECQLEIITKSNEVLYDNPHKIKVLSPLDNTGRNVAAIEDVLVNGESIVDAGVADITVPTAVSELENDEHFVDIDYHDFSKQDRLIDGETIKTINNESILGSGNLEIHEIFVKDFSNYFLFILTDNLLAQLIANHYAVIDNADLDVPEDLIDWEECRISIVLGLDTHNIRLSKNADNNYAGYIVIIKGQSIYELLVGLIQIDGDLKAVVRCADIY